MKTSNAIKKLEKAGAKVELLWKNKYSAQFKSHVVEFINQDGSAICIIVRNKNDHDDIMTDYHAGTFFSSIKSAIEFAVH